MLQTDECVLVIVDVQGKLAQLMTDRDALFKNLSTLVDGVKLFDIPVIWVEQLPEKLGPSIPEIVERLPGQTPIAKSSFGCGGDEVFRATLTETGRKHVLLCGIESHVCVYQTARQLLVDGYEVTAIADAISSRTDDNRQLGLHRMEQAGSLLSSVEMCLFELQQKAEGERFRQFVKLFK